MKFNKRHSLFTGTALLLAMTLTTVSCKKYLDVEPKEVLTSENHYQNVFDADAAVYGVYGKFMDLAEQYEILNELRADLMSPTENATPYLREISEHNVSADNPYANPRKYFEVIADCNDVLKNFKIMLTDKKMSVDDYNQRYSDVGAIRSWTYLQLGIQFGSIPYITEPITNIEEARDITKYPRISFDKLLDELLLFTEALPYKKPYTATNSLVTTIDGYTTNLFFINKEMLLGDLNLWKGNYLKAASYYKNVMETAPEGSSDYFNRYRMKYAEVVTHDDNAIGYKRYSEMDATTFVNNNSQGWRGIFARNSGVLHEEEWIWLLPFDKNFKPGNPFINLFSIQGGKYLVKPSVQAISYWDAQTQNNGFPYDARKLITYRMIGGKPVIMKFLYNYLGEFTYTPINPLEKEGKWFLYRAATLHLRFAEAANRDNQHFLANVLLNTSLKGAYDVSGTVDVTNIQQTHLAYPYNFNARQGDYPFFRDPWYRHAGVRGRAYLTAAPVVGDSTISIENNIIREAALELAYEGQRWPDLVRIALRRNDPAFLADRVYQKLLKEGNPNAATVRTKLMTKENWYLPFKWN